MMERREDRSLTVGAGMVTSISPKKEVKSKPSRECCAAEELSCNTASRSRVRGTDEAQGFVAVPETS